MVTVAAAAGIEPGGALHTRRPRRWLRVSVAALLSLVLLVGVDYVVLARRLDHVGVRMPVGGVGTTWVIVGSDSRSSLPSGRNVYGSPGRDPGARADVVLVVHEFHGHTRALTIPRDLLVHPVENQIQRLGLTFTAGPQTLVNSLCNTLHIATSRLVIATMRGLADAVDALGGVTVTVPHPIRDRLAGLNLDGHGRTHLNGRQALALVRARHLSTFIGGRWRITAGAAGALHRAGEAAQIFTALLAAGQQARANPLALQRVLWGLTSGLATDNNTSLLDLRDLAFTHIHHVRQLPAAPVGSSLAMATNAATAGALTWAGYGGGAATCRTTSR